eukprot:GFUD01037968.1.p1 GENE.GFUD01037968.1~~GFUD01037968.1.p1  ORF type:complete len:519 (+),score=133.51 GFUD01037968.1:60-1616(+)
MNCLPHILVLLLFFHESLLAATKITSPQPVASVSNSTNSPISSRESLLAVNLSTSTPLPKAEVSNSKQGIQQSKSSSKKGDDLDAKVAARASTWVLERSSLLKDNDSDENIAEYADMIPIEDELEIGDEALVLAHLEKDINDFEDLKKTIAYLEEHISKHSDVHVVASNDLVDADHMLKDLDVKVIKPYEQQLVSLKSQIVKLNNKFDNESIAEIITIVENAEMFLETTMEKVQQVEQLEQEWEVAEETVQIQEMIDLDERKSYDGKIIIEALKPSVSDKLKKKLGDQYDHSKPSKVYPVSKSNSPQLNLDKSLTEAKSMYKKMKQMKMLNSGEKHESRLKESNEEDDIDKVSKEKADRQNLELQKIAQLAKIAALRQVKEDIEREVFEDLKGKDIFADPVEHYSTGVKEALETAKEISHEFIHKKLHHDTHYEKDEEKSGAYDHVFLAVLVLVVLIVVLAVFVAFTRRKRSRVVHQNLSGVGGFDRSYKELESVKEDDGWDRGWSPWSVRKNQHKFN